jgi:hypothetical protein
MFNLYSYHGLTRSCSFKPPRPNWREWLDKEPSEPAAYAEPASEDQEVAAETEVPQEVQS